MRKLVIEKAAVRANMAVVRKRAAGAALYGVLTGDGGGAGLVPLARMLRDEGVGRFAVGSVEEAQELREAGFVDEEILMLRATVDREELERLVDLNVVCTISSVDTGLALNAVAENRSTVAEAHIQVDTGMGFGGFLVGEPEKILLAYRSLDHGEMKVSLDQFEIWQEEGSGCGPYTYEISVDNYGNQYPSCYAGPGDSYNVYKLDAKYHTLSGVFCMDKEFNSTDRVSRLYIYGDDQLLATYEITGGDAPIAFTVDVSTVTLLKIRPASAKDFDGAEMSFAADLYLWR